MFDNLKLLENLKSEDAVKLVQTLFDKIYLPIGILYEPTKKRRLANADADTMVTIAKAQAQVLDIETRARISAQSLQVREQQNIENIAIGAIEHLKPDAKPRDIDPDWIADFLDKARKKSNEEMQVLWAKILAQEANAPGSFSLKTLDVVSKLTRDDAELFMNLCRFTTYSNADNDFNDQNINPIIFGANDKIFKSLNIDFLNLHYLQDIGLINYFTNGVACILDENYSKYFFRYNKKTFSIILNPDIKEIGIGHVRFSKVGNELNSLSNHTPVVDYLEYIRDSVIKNLYLVSEITDEVQP